MRKIAKFVIYSFICCIIWTFTQPIHSIASAQDEADNNGMTIEIDGQNVTFKHPLYRGDGRIFAPAREVVEHFYGQISWNGATRQVSVITYFGDMIVFTIDEQQLLFNGEPYAMDVAPFIIDGVSYLPIRHLAEFLHADVNWDSATQTASFTRVPLYAIKEGDTLHSVSEALDLSVPLLAERNGLSDDVLSDAGLSDVELKDAELLALSPVDYLKIVIPHIMANKIESSALDAASNDSGQIDYDPEDLELLAKIIQAEAGWEPYEGQIAVGAVIMNRIASDRFPYANTIREVIYALGQFTPVSNGTLDSMVPNESVWKAAAAVLSGENNVEDALFFYNPKNTRNRSFWETLTFITQIGNHHFMK